jgi:hypothetical protein
MKWKLMNWKTNLRNQTPPSHVTVINRTTESVKSVKLQRKTYWRWKMRKKQQRNSISSFITLLVNQSLCMYLCSVLLFSSLSICATASSSFFSLLVCVFLFWCLVVWNRKWCCVRVIDEFESKLCRSVMREEELCGCWFDRNLRCLNEVNLCLIRMNQFEWFEDWIEGRIFERIEWRIVEGKKEEEDGLGMKKMVVMEVLWWLWRLKMKIEGGCGVS